MSNVPNAPRCSLHKLRVVPLNPLLDFISQFSCKSNHLISFHVTYQAGLLISTDVAFLSELVELNNEFVLSRYRISQ